MIDKLVKSDNLITIVETDGSNFTSIAPYSTRADKTEKGNGCGAGSIISYNPNSKGESIVNVDGTKGRPSFIGLSHELKLYSSA